MGLRGTVDPEAQPELAELVLAARRGRCASGCRSRGSPGWSRCSTIERYNTNATLAENLMFGAPRGEALRHRAPRGPSLRPADHRRGRARPSRWLEVGHQARRHDGRAVRRSAAGPRVFPPVQLHQRRRPAGVSRPGHPRRSSPARRAEPRRSRAADRAHLQADPGAPSPRPDRGAAAGAGARGPPALPRAAAGRARGRGRVLRGRSLHRRRQPPGQHPVRQGRVRPGPGGRADQRSDRARCWPISACASG